MNIQDILDQHNIQYALEGKNIAKGWAGISCPFCGDTKNHMGINLTSALFSCFACGAKGNFKYLLYKITGIWIDGKADKHFLTEKETIRTKEISYDFSEIRDIHKQYLEMRGYVPDEIEKLYKVKDGGFTGDYKYRLIIPYFFQNKLMTFTARDITGNQDPKYKNLPNEKSVLTTKEVLYGFDFCEDTVLVVEGIFDAWRVGKGAVALSGKIATKEQRKLLNKFKRIFVCLDRDAEVESEKLAYNLSTPFNDVHVVKLDVKDPDCLEQKDVYDLRKFLFGKIYG
jgi:DNA primase